MKSEKLNQKLAVTLDNGKLELVTALKKEAYRGLRGPSRTTDTTTAYLYLNENGNYSLSDEDSVDGVETEVDVEYVYSPPEKQTYHYPGAPADVEILRVKRTDNGEEINNWNSDELNDGLAEQLIENTVDRYEGQKEDAAEAREEMRREDRMLDRGASAERKLVAAIDKGLAKKAEMSADDFDTLERIVKEKNPMADDMGIENLVNGILKENPTTLDEAVNLILDNKEPAEQVANPLNGKSKQAAKNYIYRLIGDSTQGFFTDNSWENIHAIWNKLDEAGIDNYLTDSKYYGGVPGAPDGKRWDFEVNFINKRGNEDKLYGYVVAAFAGTVADPTSRYDIVFVVS